MATQGRMLTLAASAISPFLIVILTPIVFLLFMLLRSKGPVIENVPGPLIGRFFAGIDTKYAFISGRSASSFHALHKSYGDIVRFAPGQVTTNTVKAFRNIYGSGAFLKTDFYKGISRRNIFTATEPAYHTPVRKLFSPSFSPGCLKSHEGVIRDCILKLHGVYKEKLRTSGDTLSLNNLLYCHSVDTVAEVLLGKSLGCLDRGRPYFWTEQLPRIFYWATIRNQFQGSGVPTLLKWMLRRFLAKGVRLRNEEARMRLIYEQLKTVHTRRDIMVEVLERAELGSELPESEIAENFSAIMLAGFHTTQNALCATIYFVLTNPSVHSKLVAELQSTFSCAGDISCDLAAGLPYLNAVITESLRVHSPVPIGSPRVSQEGMVVDGVFIPPGVEICTTLYALHRNPDYFGEPDTFCPERWTEGLFKAKRDAVQPFLIGSRSCIAKYFAQQMLQLTLAAFFLEFDATYVGQVKDWQRETKCYAFWELPDLTVQMRTRFDA
ncbi:benzoate 4-monooxygenase cytochrome P450 [Talaromyces proteolyticus]|uniref:Benzoate 4-monooxygenase cytochrome P450 n=1 Tax=Talaromyces proteolyticus TaxID=1131652 RepID=A0AAD4KS46_9EURO|nr:benzoate 4-monooxygenase cytochrome P450 [Talaromyces proteolyticus]KAH8694292.1 benzoate 4-monooxygenase cytochrome P450 [Talaromyces proteolyticus]